MSSVSAAHLVGPTAGYLFAFAAAAVVGWFVEKGWGKSILLTALAMCIGTVAIFTGGIAWLSTFTGFTDCLEIDRYVPALVRTDQNEAAGKLAAFLVLRA